MNQVRLERLCKEKRIRIILRGYTSRLMLITKVSKRERERERNHK